MGGDQPDFTAEDLRLMDEACDELPRPLPATDADELLSDLAFQTNMTNESGLVRVLEAAAAEVRRLRAKVDAIRRDSGRVKASFPVPSGPLNP